MPLEEAAQIGDVAGARIEAPLGVLVQELESVFHAGRKLADVMALMISNLDLSLTRREQEQIFHFGSLHHPGRGSY